MLLFLLLYIIIIRSPLLIICIIIIVRILRFIVNAILILILGVNYLQGDKSEYLDLDSENRLGLTLSTQITDKILINGEIGVPFGGVEETLIVGDVQIDFILNEDGSLKAKVFNKENEFRYIGDELGYTQGVGISYEVDFETFSELLSKILISGGNS